LIIFICVMCLIIRIGAIRLKMASMEISRVCQKVLSKKVGKAFREKLHFEDLRAYKALVHPNDPSSG